MASSLFVAHQNVVNLILIVINGVVHGHNRPARIAENGFYALLNQRPDDRMGAIHQFSRFG